MRSASREAQCLAMRQTQSKHILFAAFGSEITFELLNGMTPTAWTISS
jgi:hypothetical protein